MPQGIKRHFGMSDAAHARAERYAHDKGGGEIDGAVHVIECFVDTEHEDSTTERVGVIWVASSDKVDELVADADGHQIISTFGFDEDPHLEEAERRLSNRIDTTLRGYGIFDLVDAGTFLRLTSALTYAAQDEARITAGANQ